MNSLVVELVKVTGKERILLEQCKDFLSTLAAMQVSEAVWQNHIPKLDSKHLFIYSLLLIFVHRNHNHPNDRSRIVA